jgi:hypothetical protein
MWVALCNALDKRACNFRATTEIELAAGYHAISEGKKSAINWR